MSRTARPLLTRLRTIAVVGSALLLVSACGAAGPGASVPSDTAAPDATSSDSAPADSAEESGRPTTAGGEGEPLDIAGSWVLADNDAITLEITAEGAASGRSACNGYGGHISRDAETGDLLVGPAVSTLMACEDALMAAEGAYLEAYQNVVAGEIVDGQLVLTTGDGATLVFDAA